METNSESKLETKSESKPKSESKLGMESETKNLLSDEQRQKLKSKGKQLVNNSKELAFTVKNMAWNEIHSLGDKWMPTLKNSQFEKGVLTPSEFVKTGDHLVYKFGSWSWCSALDKGKRDYLPRDKQYLITLGVPCEKRATDFNQVEIEVSNNDDWNTVVYEGNENESVNDFESLNENETIKDFKSMNEIGSKLKNVSNKELDKLNEINKINELSEFEDLIEDEDLAAVTNFVMCRRYDIMITYDNFYQTPRIWLKGMNEFGIPLNHEEIFEDIVLEYRNRTVTLERFPYSGELMVSIHPCRHAETMKRFIEKSRIKPEDYLLIFLKFISSVLPTINYDFTVAI